MPRIVSQLPAMRESEFRDQVVQLARVFRWTCYWTWQSIHSPAGFPDLVLCRPPRLVVAELKVGRNRLTWHQNNWLDLLQGVPCVEVKIWRPEDWSDIEATLR